MIQPHDALIEVGDGLHGDSAMAEGVQMVHEIGIVLSALYLLQHDHRLDMLAPQTEYGQLGRHQRRGVDRRELAEVADEQQREAAEGHVMQLEVAPRSPFIVTLYCLTRWLGLQALSLYIPFDSSTKLEVSL